MKAISKHPLYPTYANMRYRCMNPASKDWERYGGRGIQICQRWLDSFQAFVDDVGPRPQGMTLDRIDNNKNYEPGNVKWSTQLEQVRNSNRKFGKTHKSKPPSNKRQAEKLVDSLLAEINLE